MLGAIISHYRVLDRLGGGGMGDVFRAEDIRLGRLVALKFLPRDIANDLTALERFRREARAASSINHANICTVYDIDESDHGPFLVMELLDGISLKQRIAAGPIPVDDVIEWSLQITDALDAAHAKQVVHRDLKPANLFITARNHAKVLDFGLAKLTVSRRAVGAGATTTDTRSLDFETSPGTTIGTISYMSPEQVRGEDLDGRSDVFSFGVVLYEMVTGTQPFAANTSGLIFDAILNRTPELPGKSNPNLPIGLEQIITKCLEKDRKLRYQTVSDLHSDLARLKRDSSSGHSISVGAYNAASRMRRRWVVLLAVAGFIGITGLVFWVARNGRTTPPPRKVIQITANPAELAVSGAALSPDGRYVAYSDLRGVHIHLVDSGESQLLTDTAGFVVRFWTRDGTKVRVNRPEPGKRGEPWLISVVGGARQPAPVGIPSPDGSLLVEYRQNVREVWVSSPAGDSPKLVRKFEENELPSSPWWSPNSKRVAYILLKKRSAGTGAPDHSIETIATEGGPPVPTIPPSPEAHMLQSLTWLADGRIVFARDTKGDYPVASDNLWAVPVDADTGIAAGSPVQLTDWEGYELSGLSSSRDGRRLTVIRRTQGEDVYVARLTKGGTALDPPQRLTLDERLDMPTGWTADSSAVLFSSNRTGEYNVYRQALGQDTSVPMAPNGIQSLSARTSYNGWVLLQQLNPKVTPVERRIVRVPAQGGSPALVYRVPPSVLNIDYRCARNSFCVLQESIEGRCVVSQLDVMNGKGRELFNVPCGGDFDLAPDGTWLARIQPGTPPNRIGIYTLDGKLQREITVRDVSLSALDITAAGDGFIAGSSMPATGATLLHVDMKGTALALWKQPASSRIWGIPSPDGKHVAIFVTPREANVWLIENP